MVSEQVAAQTKMQEPVQLNEQLVQTLESVVFPLLSVSLLSNMFFPPLRWCAYAGQA